LRMTAWRRRRSGNDIILLASPMRNVGRFGLAAKSKCATLPSAGYGYAFTIAFFAFLADFCSLFSTFGGFT